MIHLIALPDKFNGGPMENNGMYKHKDKLQTLITEGRTQAGMAREIGISPTVLTQYLQGSYHERGGNVEKVNQKIEHWLYRTQERAEHWKEEILDLSITNRISKILKVAFASRENALIWGPAGLGKTLAVKRFAEREPNAVLVTARNSVRSVKGALILIYKGLSNKDIKGSATQIYDEIIALLKGRDKIIIVDQAHRLSNQALQELQAIYDETGVPFALIGTDTIHKRLKDPNSNTVLAEMISRITIHRHFDLTPEKNDLNAVCSMYGVDDPAIVRIMAGKSTYGGLRIVARILSKACWLAGGMPTMKEVEDSIKITEYKGEK